MACLAGPSFHEGRGPVPSEVEGSWARPMVVVKTTTPTSAAARRFRWYLVFMVVIISGLNSRPYETPVVAPQKLAAHGTIMPRLGPAPLWDFRPTDGR